MSRSRKKHGFQKYGSMYRGRRYNKKFRVRNKHRVRMGEDPYQMFELVDPWDVCDVRSYWVNAVKSARTPRQWSKPYTEEEIQTLTRRYFMK